VGHASSPEATRWRIASWNVNGLRAADRKGFSRWLAGGGCHLIGVQEVRARPEELPATLRSPTGFRAYFRPAERPGYSGVGTFCRREPDDLSDRLGIARFDVEGRFQRLRFGRLEIVNAYFPKGSGSARDNSRVPYKLDFYRAVFDVVQTLRGKGRRVLVLGDFNTAHREIDLARPKANVHTSGFLPVERAELDRWCAAGWIDTFRAFVTAPGHYSWWSQRAGARARNIGWRIDYVLASPAAMAFVRDAFIWPHVRGSDHCPVGVTVDPGIVR